MGDETTATWVDRTGWETGPWDSEPDRVEWRSRGFACLILRGPYGALCGYVGVPDGHPWFGADYGDRRLSTADEAAHGGLTFASACMEDSRPVEQRVCHVPREGESDAVWWLGFDCAHAWDRAPGQEARYRELAARARAKGDHRTAEIFSQFISDASYKTLGYVRDCVEDLALAAEQAR